MRRWLKRAGWIAASIALAWSAGCADQTEIPLAKVAPVTPAPQGPPHPSRGRAASSPMIIQGHN